MFNQAARPGTVRTAIGDAWGRCFWVVRLADGTETNVYFSFPPEMAITSVGPGIGH